MSTILRDGSDHAFKIGMLLTEAARTLHAPFFAIISKKNNGIATGWFSRENLGEVEQYGDAGSIIVSTLNCLGRLVMMGH